jgi:hypothetical protein
MIDSLGDAAAAAFQYLERVNVFPAGRASCTIVTSVTRPSGFRGTFADGPAAIDFATTVSAGVGRERNGVFY